MKEAISIGLNAKLLEPALNDKLLQLNDLYSEMAQRANTDFDERNYHDHEISKIIEMSGEQIFYQQEKDWHYRKEERRYIPLNDESSWRTAQFDENGAVVISKYHLR